MPRGAPATKELATSSDDSTRTKILKAALECFMQLGISRTSLHDVARHAQVSRGTVYRYFSERQELIDATIELRAQKYYDEAAKKMGAFDTLSEQIGAFGEVVGRNVADYVRHRLREDDSMLMRLSASDRDGALRRMTHFLVPYLEAAGKRGELRCRCRRRRSERVACTHVDVGHRHAELDGVRCSSPEVGRAFHGSLRRRRSPGRVSDTTSADIEAVKTVMARYFRFMDTKQWTALRGILADDMSMSAPDDVADSTAPRRCRPSGAHGRTRPRTGRDDASRLPPRDRSRRTPTRRTAIWAMDDLVEFADAPDNSFRGMATTTRPMCARR